MRVLFVDDDVAVLDGLRRYVERLRPDWTGVFVDGGTPALAALDGEPFDALVSDLEMPGVSGAELLARARERSPSTIRLALSGLASRDEVLKVVGPAHQFLAKPCEPADLVATLERARTLRRRLGDDDLLRVVGGVESLPTLPTLYAEITRALNGPDSSLARVAAIVEGDPATSANVLKLVNSAWFGVRREVTNIGHALALIGTDTISTLILARGYFRQFDQATLAALAIEPLWERSLATRRLAVEIARDDGAGRGMEELTGTAALLHDIGLLVLASTYPGPFADVVRDADGSAISRSSLERAVIGASHGEIGAYLLALWGLPDPIVAAVASHDTPSVDANPEVEALTYVHVAATLAEHAAALARGDQSVDALPLDRDYLASVGRLEALPRWVAIATESPAPEEVA